MTIYVGVVQWINSETENMYVSVQYDKVLEYLKEIHSKRVYLKMWVETWEDGEYITMEEIDI